jgi:hypothetical protein
MLSPPSLIHRGRSAHGGVYVLLIVLRDYITTTGSWPSTLRLPGLTTHKPPAYKNSAHQPIKHNDNSFQNLVYNGARPWGHYKMGLRRSD